MQFCKTCACHVPINFDTCTNCGAKTFVNRSRYGEFGGVGWYLLGLLLPPIGFIYFAKNYRYRPHSANSVGLGIVTFLVGLLFGWAFYYMLFGYFRLF